MKIPSQQLWTSAATQMCHKNLNTMKTKRTIVHSGKRLSVDVITHTWEQQSVYSSVDTRFGM